MLFHYETGKHPVPEQVLNKLTELEIVLGIPNSTLVESSSKNVGNPTFPPNEPAHGNSKNLEFPPNEPAHGNVRNLTFPKNPQSCGFSDDTTRRIPVIGWAHAGQAASYEEMPEDWQQMIPTDCRDPKAFAVMLEGDSMEPLFRDGDLLVLMPSQRIHNGCLAVIRLASDGVLLRRVEVREERLRLVPLNPRYEAEEMSGDQISWAYPVWGRWSQVWK